MEKRKTRTSQACGSVRSSILRLVVDKHVAPEYAVAAEAARIDVLRHLAAGQSLGRVYDERHVAMLERCIELMRVHVEAQSSLAEDTSTILGMISVPHFSRPTLRLRSTATAAEVLDAEALAALLQGFSAQAEGSAAVHGHATQRRSSLRGSMDLTRAKALAVDNSVTMHAHSCAAHRRALLVMQVAIAEAPLAEFLRTALHLIGLQQEYHRTAMHCVVQKLAWLRDRRDIPRLPAAADDAPPLPPPFVVRAWHRSGEAAPVAGEVRGVAVVFADVVGFTRICASLQPDEVVDSMKAMFALLDAAAETCGVRCIETIGDCYVAACGISSADVASEAPARAAAFALMAAEACVVAPRDAGEMRMRVGMHVGAVCATTLCARKFTVYGAAVNMAARMEQSSEAGRVTVAAEVAELLPDAHLTSRGDVDVKGHGTMHLFWLDGTHKPPASKLVQTRSASDSSPHVWSLWS